MQPEAGLPFALHSDSHKARAPVISLGLQGDQRSGSEGNAPADDIQIRIVDIAYMIYTPVGLDSFTGS